MTKYRVEMMTKNDYFTFMSDGHNYDVKVVHATAETKERAIEMVKEAFPKMVINDRYVIEVK